MAQRLCLLLLTFWSSVAWGQSSPYCSFTGQHTLCLHVGIGETCGNQVQARGVGAQDAALILAQHNQLRSRVAMGQEGRGTPGPQPQASNMRLLEWDDELALVAQSHADQCIFEHECSDCRRVSRFGVGQNLFISFQSNFDTRIQWGRAIKAWYDEVAEFDPNVIQPFQFSAPVGHYTQMMWWNTFKVGCGYTMFKDGSWWKKLYTCNYGPGGNIIFSEMYRRGSPCSSCPAGTTCSLRNPGPV
ncbi:CRISP/Allergen/PR-1-like [Macrobrachium nipponense]|uniref:CRISP/Allergen/PR-1-like n=1 Tax=Macrobrachium nipponense TaxID=159736 RepID=UPI0030C8030B